MKRYKSIFKESKFRSDIINSKDAKQIVDISNLTLNVIKDDMTWEEAMSKQKNEWRLPTIQELWTICVKYKNGELETKDARKIDHEESYWSSTTHGLDNYVAWGVEFYGSFCSEFKKKNKHGVLLVK